jgi:hypothetical protein
MVAMVSVATVRIDMNTELTGEEIPDLLHEIALRVQKEVSDPSHP